MSQSTPLISIAIASFARDLAIESAIFKPVIGVLNGSGTFFPKNSGSLSLRVLPRNSSAFKVG